MPSVSGLYANALDTFLGERGLPMDAPAAAPFRRVGGGDYAQSLILGARELGDPALGLRFGTRVGAAGFGMLGIAAATAPTLRDAIRHLTQLESITSTLGQASTHVHGKLVSLVWHPAQAVSPVVVEGILAGWVSFGRYLLGERVDVVMVGLAHQRMAASHLYDSTLECPVRFNADRYSVTIAADLLDAGPRFADDLLSGSLNGWLRQCAEGKPLTQTISTMWGARLAMGGGDEVSIAAELGMGRRALQRALQIEGTSFRHIVNAARAQHAVVQILRGRTNLSDLGAAIGFDEQTSLCRAFKRWTGYAPLAFRQRMATVFQPLRP